MDQKGTVIVNAIKRYFTYKDDHDKLVASNKTEAEYKTTQFKTVILLKKRKSDPAVPNKASDVKEMYAKFKGRAVPLVDKYLMDLGYKREEFDSYVQQFEASLIV